MTLGIPLKVPFVELEFFIERVVAVVVERASAQSGREKEEREEPGVFATGVGSHPELSAAFGIRGERDPPVQTQSNFINHPPDEEIADKITWFVRRPPRRRPRLPVHLPLI